MSGQLYVIGSGPAGVSCAHALAAKGGDVTVLDCGQQLEPDRQRIVETLRRVGPQEWDAASVASIREGSRASASGIPVKRVYGSDFPYRGVNEHIPYVAEQVVPFSSLAKGGLSNVWGAAMLPYRAQDIADWPISAAELAPYFEAVLRFVPLAAEHDDLEESFPLYASAPQQLAPSPQAKRLIEHMRKQRVRLAVRGFVVGRSRLAVWSQPSDGRGCVYCGLCMYGCPYGLIYNSAVTLDELVRQGQVRYIRDVVVDELAEANASVTISAHDRGTGRSLRFEADRVFLGAGVIPTSHIMLKSLKRPNVTLTMRDSQYFLLPLLGLRGVSRAGGSNFHTLAQIFLEVSDTDLCPYPVHMQVYTYNDLYTDAMKNTLGSAYALVKAPAAAVLRRLMVIQGYLHSNVSGTASVTLEHDRLVLRKQESKAARRTVRAVVAKLLRNASALGFVPLAPLLKIGDPGQGAHIGGTFPMRNNPGPLESDRLGRPYGFSRVHIVDASILPSIPQTTITLNAMANAYRIGSEWDTYGI